MIAGGNAASAADQGLLQLFYQCPVGLIETDDQLAITRINPAAVALLTAVAPEYDLRHFRNFLGRVAPAALAAIDDRPERLGRLAGEERLLIAAPTDGPGRAHPVELQIVRVRPGHTLVVVLDISNEVRSVARQNARVRDVQRRLLMPDARSDGPGTSATADIASLLAEWADADLALLLVGQDTRTALTVLAAAGAAADLVGPEVDGALVRTVMETGAVLGADLAAQRVDLTGVPRGRYGAALLLPLPTGEDTAGVALVARQVGRPPFTSVDATRIDMLTGIATLAVEAETVAALRLRLIDIEQREQAHRAHLDATIQNLYATGLQLEALAQPDDVVTAPRVAGLVDRLNHLIRDTRGHLTAASGQRPPPRRV